MATRTVEIVNAVAERLKANLPVLASVEGLSAPKEVLRYQPDSPSVTKSPQIGVSTGEIVRSDDPSDGATLRTYIQVPTLRVWIYIAAPDPEALEIQRQSYADIVQRSLEDENWETDFDIEWQSTTPEDSFKEAATLYQRTRLEFRIRTLVVIGVD